MTKHWFRISLSIVLLTAFFLRFYQLGQVPVSLYWDETAILLDAKTVSQNGLDMHGNSWWQVLFPSYGDFKLPVYIWLTALSVKIVGVTQLAVRLPSAIAGLATVVMVGLIAKELFFKLNQSQRRLLQLLSMLVVAVSPWSIMFSRTGFEGHLGQLFLAISVWIILKSRTKEWLVLLSPLLGALATYTYFSVRFVWPVVFVATLCLSLGRKARKWILPALVIFGGLLLPMVRSPLYETSNQFRYSTTSVLNAHDYPLQANQYRKLTSSSLVDRILFHRHWLLIRELMKNYADNLSPNYLFLTGDPNLRHGTGEHGLFLLVFLPILLIGLFNLSKEHRWELLVLIIWWLVALLPASVPETTPHALRSLNALVPISLILSVGLMNLSATKSKVLNLTVFTLITLSTLEFGYHYFTQYRADSAYDWQDGYQAMAREIIEALPEVSDVYINEFDDRFYLWILLDKSFSAQEIQALVKDNYQVKKIAKVTFQGYHWSKIDSLDRKILVVGLKKDIDDNLQKYQVKTRWEKDISQADGTQPFKVVMVERQN